MMIRSLYVKFALYTVLIMLISGCIAFFIVNTIYHQYVKEENDAKNMHILERIVAYGSEVEDLHTFLQTEADVGYKLLLIDPQGGTTMFGEPFRDAQIDNRTVERVLNGKRYHGMRDFPKETFVTGFFADEATNSVGMPITYDGKTYALFMRPNIKLLFSEAHFLLGGLMTGMLLISLIAMLWMARKLIQPLTALTNATKQVGEEQFSIHVPLDRHDEIGQLAKSFYTMAENLERVNKMRKQFTNDITHDIQTPLQHIKGYTDLLLDDTLSDEKKRSYKQIIIKETERLSSLTRQLLILTSLDTVTEKNGWTNVRVDEQLYDILHRFRWQFEEKEITVQTSLRRATVFAERHYLENVWENLLTNALKYNRQGGEVHVTCEKSKGDVIVQIVDTGIGIAKEKLPFVFDRFYRADEARNSNVSGTGLGLAIVQQIVSLHKGRVTIESEIHVGTTCTIILPGQR